MAQSALEAISSIKNLEEIWKEFLRRSGAKSSSGIDWVTPDTFRRNLRQNLSLLSTEIRDGYTFSALRGVVLPKKDPTKTRLICVPTIADRLVQRAILAKIQPKAEALGIQNEVSYGFVNDIPGSKRGTHAAQEMAVKFRSTKPWIMKTDISAFFDNINRQLLIEDLGRKLSLRSLQPLIYKAINSEVLSDNNKIRQCLIENKIRPGIGLRQGMPLSPTLSNFVLRRFDKTIGAKWTIIRYADDMVVFGSSRAECEEAQAMVEAELGKVKLSISMPKTAIYEPNDSVEFLGMELGRATGRLGYTLAISKSQMENIRSAFRIRHDWQEAHQQKLNVADLFIRLEQMKRGYLNAYHMAENKRILEEKVDRWAKNCAEKIYSSIFGEDRVRTLNANQKAFLMLP